jgi:hypothetical protein
MDELMGQLKALSIENKCLRERLIEVCNIDMQFQDWTFLIM